MSGSEQHNARQGADFDGFIPFPSNHNTQRPQNQHRQQQQQQQQWRFHGSGRGRGGGIGGGRGGGGRGQGRGFRGRWRGGPGSGGRHVQHQQQRQPRFQGDDRIEELGDVPSSADDDHPRISIAVEGCCHGELDAIYERLLQHEATTGRKVDVLLCCGDFQSLRNMADFHSLAVPPKYRSLGSFYRYYSGEKVAPVLTVFIGGNHEASQPLQELSFGGWVAPNIYYMGFAGVVSYNGVRIGGISGIYKSHDYRKGRFECPPFDNSTMRSIYHVRNVDVYRLKCLAASSSRATRKNMNQPPLDVMMSHDWPQGIEQHGDTAALLRMKPFFREEIERNDLGSPPNCELLEVLQPKWWFAAHLHVKFQATVSHSLKGSEQPNNATSTTRSITNLVPSQAIINTAATTSQQAETTEQQPSSPQPSGSSQDDLLRTTQFVAMESIDPCAGPDLTAQMTRFLSLDKCLPRRQYLSIVHVPVSERHSNAKLQYDLEWLAVLKKTHDLSNTSNRFVEMPRNIVSVTDEDVEWVRQRFGSSNSNHEPLVIPNNFFPTVPAHAGPSSPLPRPLPPPFPRMGNPQTDQLLKLLQLNHVTTIPYSASSLLTSSPSPLCPAAFDVNEIFVEEEEREGLDKVEAAAVGNDENEIVIDDEEDGVDATASGGCPLDARDENEIELVDDQEDEDQNYGDAILEDSQTSSAKKPRVASSSR